MQGSHAWARTVANKTEPVTLANVPRLPSPVYRRGGDVLSLAAFLLA